MDELRQLVALVRDIHAALDFQQRLQELAVQSNPFFDGTLPRLLLSTSNPLNGGPFVTTPAIQPFYGLAQGVADMGLIAAGVWSGYRIMWAHGLRNQHTLRILLPRLILAFFLINFSLRLIQLGVDASNTVCSEVAALSGTVIVRDVVAVLASGRDVPPLSFLTLLALFAGYGVLAIGYVVRFALMVILAILSPLAALCFVLPETQHYAREWGSLFVSSLLMQPMQLLILAVGFQLDATISDTPARHLFGLAALLITFKVPGALHSVSSAGTKAAEMAHRHANHLVHAVAVAARAA